MALCLKCCLKSLLCLGILWITASLMYAAEKGRTVHYYDDFEGEFKLVQPDPSADSTVSGLFPSKWSENSVWKGAAVDVVYDRLSRAVHEGQSSWRIDCRSVKAGRSQMGISPVPLDGRRFIEITFAARSDHASSFRMAINMSGTPWKTYWQTDVGLTSEWQTYRYLVPPSTTDPTSRFQIVIDRPARIDLDNVKISYLEPGLVIGDGDPDGNLLFQGAFSAGVAGAWVAEPADRPELVYRVDPSEVGPSGLPSLRLESDPLINGRPMVQVTQAFRAVGGRGYVASAWVKGQQNGQVVHLRIGPASEQLWKEPWQKNISLTTEWQRIELPMKLPYTPDGYHLFRITSHSGQPFWLDACQVEVGDVASTWNFGGPTPSEVVITSSKNRGLHLDDEHLQANVIITANTTGTDRLVGSLTDIRGVD